MFRAVVIRRVVMTRHRHCRVDRRDGLVAVRHVEGHRREVRVRVGELFRSKAHVRSAGIRPGCRGRAAEGHVSALVQRRAERGVEARHRVFRSVVGSGVVMARHRHRSVDPVDLLVAVHHIEGHVGEVRVRVGELAFGKTHVGLAGIRPGRLRRAAEREVSGGVERSVDGHVVAAHAVNLSVIIHRVVMARDGHHHLVQRGDRLVTVRHIERHRAEVRRVQIRELTVRETHVRRAGSRSGSGCRAREHEVRALVQRRAVRGVEARHRVLGSVIHRAVVMARHRHRRLYRADRLVAVGHIERHRLEVVVVVGELAGGKAHIRRAGIRPGGGRRAAEREVRAFVQRRAVRGVEARHRVPGSVIIRGVVMARHRHRRIDLVDSLVTVRHVERHRAEVRVRVGELAGGETHVGGAGIRPGRRGRAVKGHV